MVGNYRVQFLGGHRAAMPVTYPVKEQNDIVNQSGTRERKIQLEIKELARPIFLRPSFLVILVSLSTGLFGFLSGFLQIGIHVKLSRSGYVNLALIW